jgi:hypothetical protein
MTRFDGAPRRRSTGGGRGAGVLLCLLVAAGGVVTAQADPARGNPPVTVTEQVTVDAPPTATNNGRLPWRVGYELDASGPVLGATVGGTADAKQSFVGATVTSPPDWTVSWSDGTTTFTPTPSATTRIVRFTNLLLPRRSTGRAVVAPPPPEAVINAPTTGDGYVPTILEGRAYMVHHHHHDVDKPISCTDLTTKLICPDYPTNLGAYANNAPSAPVAVDGKLWFKINDAGLGLVCIDPPTGTSCGRVNLVNRPKSIWDMGLDRSSQPVAIGTKIYLVVDDHNVYCLDASTKLACSGYPKPTALAGSLAALPAKDGNNDFAGQVGLIDVAVDGNRLYASLADDFAWSIRKPSTPRGYLHCFDVATGQPCTGWSGPVTVVTAAGDRFAFAVFFRKNAAGARTGVCLGSQFSRTCVGLDGTNPTTRPTPEGMWGTFNASNCCWIPYLAAWHEAEGPTRTFHAGGGFDHRPNDAGLGSAVFCWDWVTDDPCATNGYTNGLRRGLPPNSPGGPYGFTTVGTCAWGATDRKVLFSFDTTDGNPGCKRQTVSVTVAPERFYCDNATRSLSWSEARLSDASLTPGNEFNAARLSVVNTGTGAVVAGPVELLGTTGVVGLTGIPWSTNKELRVDVDLVAVGTKAWDDNVAPKVELIFDGDPVQFCVDPMVSLTCDTSPREVTLAAVTGTGARAARAVAVASDANCAGTVSGTVVEDTNRNGAIDVADPPIAGISVTIRRNGTTVATTTTSSTGAYTMAIAPPGQYVVQIAAGSYEVAVDPDGTLDGTTTVTVATAGTVTANFGLRAGTDRPAIGAA